jgi:hypothetical protein
MNGFHFIKYILITKSKNITGEQLKKRYLQTFLEISELFKNSFLRCGSCLISIIK